MISYRHDSFKRVHRWRDRRWRVWWVQGKPRWIPLRVDRSRTKIDSRWWLGVWMFTLWACVCAWACDFSINNPSIRGPESMFANIYILDNVVSPTLCSNITTSTIWIMHPRKIRGNGRNACFIEKCTFYWENACFVIKNTFQCEMPNVSRNNNAYYVEKCTFHCKMPNVSRNNNAYFIENACFFIKNA